MRSALTPLLRFVAYLLNDRSYNNLSRRWKKWRFFLTHSVHVLMSRRRCIVFYCILSYRRTWLVSSSISRLTLSLLLIIYKLCDVLSRSRCCGFAADFRVVVDLLFVHSKLYNKSTAGRVSGVWSSLRRWRPIVIPALSTRQAVNGTADVKKTCNKR